MKPNFQTKPKKKGIRYVKCFVSFYSRWVFGLFSLMAEADESAMFVQRVEDEVITSTADSAIGTYLSSIKRRRMTRSTCDLCRESGWFGTQR